MERFGTDFTQHPTGFVERWQWYQSRFFNAVVKPSKWDNPIYSQVGIIRPGVMDGLSVVRRLGEEPYTLKRRRDAAAITRAGAVVAKYDPLDGATPCRAPARSAGRNRRGESSQDDRGKNMGVSDHTVHTYERALFERAKVTSRAELMAMVSKLVRRC